MVRVGLVRALLIVAAAVALTVAVESCNTAGPPPGDEMIGTFALHADPTASACGLSDVPDGGFDFAAVFSTWLPGSAFGDTAYVTLQGIPEAGHYDGGTLSASYTAVRTFADCGGCDTSITETMVVYLLSQSQDTALGDSCPASMADVPLNPDAGIVAPAPTADGFDAVRACGTLHDAVNAKLDPLLDGGCIAACFTCTLDYALSGDRK
jgi:hypothetical protein